MTNAECRMANEGEGAVAFPFGSRHWQSAIRYDREG